MPKPLTNDFLEFLSSNSHDENGIQNFLENHTELIPMPYMLNHFLHHNCVISKYKLGAEFVTDFAYLTKSSNKWYFVLMELEAADKQIFCSDGSNFTAGFNAALRQVEQWQTYISRNSQTLIDNSSILRRPMEDNIVYFRYVLICGRSSYITTQEHHDLIANKERNQNIRIMTYDSLISEYENSRINIKKVVLSPKGDRHYKIKVLPENDFDTSIFSKLQNGELEVPNEFDEILRNNEYDIDSWRNGNLLILNNRHPNPF